MTLLKTENQIPTPLGIIVLRNWSPRDEKSLQKNANSFSIWKNMNDPFPHPFTMNHAKEYIEKAVNSRKEKIYAIDFGNEAIGTAEIKLKEGIYEGNAELSFWLGENYRNQGFGSLIVNFLSDTAFVDLKARRVFARIFSGNKAGVRVMQKNDFSLEGTFRNAVVKGDEIMDEFVFAKQNPASASINV